MDYIIGIMVWAGVVWFLYRGIFCRFSYIRDYEEAADLDLKEFKDGMTLEEAHRHRDKVLRKARID